MLLMEATPEYVAFRDGALDTRYRYPRRHDTNTPIRLAAGPTWGALFTGGGVGTFYAAWMPPEITAGTVSYSSGGIYTSITVTGAGTVWDSSMVGKALMVGGGHGIFLIEAVASATSLTAYTAAVGAPGSYSGVPYRICGAHVLIGGSNPGLAGIPGDMVSVDK